MGVAAVTSGIRIAVLSLLLVCAGGARAETPEEWVRLLSRVHGGFGSFLPVGIRIGEDIVKSATDRVGQHQSARQECNAQQDGGGGSEEPQLLGGELFDGEAQHWTQSPSFLMRSRTVLAVGASIWSTMRPSARNTARSA